MTTSGPLVFQDDPDIKVMMAGSTLRKVKSRLWKKQRHFRLLEDGLSIWYKSRWLGKGHSTCTFPTTRESHSVTKYLCLIIIENFPSWLLGFHVGYTMPENSPAFANTIMSIVQHLHSHIVQLFPEF